MSNDKPPKIGGGPPPIILTIRDGSANLAINKGIESSFIHSNLNHPLSINVSEALLKHFFATKNPTFMSQLALRFLQIVKKP